ncbi:hypothetical protein NQ314_020515 [Rhamnusium bicolor]|uniref:Cytochrome P450 n=1 Tax=Rhamnusium bicolor TaxID=1586634 RepID=A0AAV8WJY8_9CUCU|nr:hypothetical protein NQ314_020515 [Rhamnusium bicolor]
MIVDLDVLKHILVKDFNNFVDRGFYSNEKDDPISAHLFALGGQKWKNLRAKMTPAFTSGKLKAMFPTVMDAGVILEKYIEEHAKIKQAIDIKEVLGKKFCSPTFSKSKV